MKGENEMKQEGTFEEVLLLLGQEVIRVLIEKGVRWKTQKMLFLKPMILYFLLLSI